MAIRFAKVDANLDGHPKVRRAGRNGREVFLFVLRCNANLDRCGRVPSSYIEPWYLADQLMMSEADAADGVARSVAAGLLRLEDGCVVIGGWDDDWAKRPMDEAERKAAQRSRDKPKSAETPTSYTESRNVTTDIVTGSDCPDCHTSDKSRVDKRRLEENRDIPPSASIGSLKAKVDEVKQPRKHRLPDDWTPERSEVNAKAETAARSRGVDLASELLKLHDWAKGGSNKRSDWDAVWRNWTRNAKPTNGHRYTPNPHPTQVALDELARLEREEQLRKESA